MLFQDILAAEKEDGRRILAENDSAIAFVPYFARYAYEVYVAPEGNACVSGGPVRRASWTIWPRVLKRVLVQYDNLWRMSFPYVMALHQVADRRRGPFRLPLPHRVSPSAAKAGPAEVSRRTGDRRRELPERHLPGGEGRRTSSQPEVHYKQAHDPR